MTSGSMARHGEAWPEELIIACDMRSEAYYRQTDRMTDITTELHIASFAFTGADTTGRAEWLVSYIKQTSTIVHHYHLKFNIPQFGYQAE